MKKKFLFSASISCCLVNPKLSEPGLVVCELWRMKSVRAWRKGKWPADFQGRGASLRKCEEKQTVHSGRVRAQPHQQAITMSDEVSLASWLNVLVLWFHIKPHRNSFSLQFLPLGGDQAKTIWMLTKHLLRGQMTMPWQFINGWTLPTQFLCPSGVARREVRDVIRLDADLKMEAHGQGALWSFSESSPDSMNCLS